MRWPVETMQYIVSRSFILVLFDTMKIDKESGFARIIGGNPSNSVNINTLGP